MAQRGRNGGRLEFLSNLAHDDQPRQRTATDGNGRFQNRIIRLALVLSFKLTPWHCKPAREPRNGTTRNPKLVQCTPYYR